MTMNGELLQSLMNPLPQKKMAGLEGTIGSLATAEDLHRFPNNQLPQYSGTYFTCEPRLPDGDNLPPFWGPPNRSLLNGRNALIHSPSEKGSPPNHVVYAADNQQFPTEGNHASPAQDLPQKQGFSYYTSPETRRIMTPGGGTTGPVRKHPVGSGNASPTSGNSICLAFPKPIYGHSPCCSELGCTARPRYRGEPGEQRVDPNVFEEDWVLYSHRALLHGSNPAFLHQRPTQLERSTDRLPLRDVAADQFINLSQNEKRTLPAFTESNYISYPCTPTRPLVAPSIEPCQGLQIPSKAFHGLYPSHAPTYKHMTSVHLASSSQLYQNPSPMSTYGQLTQQQLVYYPQANVEAQSGVAYKDVGGKYKADVNPSVHRNSPPNPLAHYLVSQPRFSDVPLIMTPPPSHSFLRGYEHSSNPVYRMNLTSDQMRSTIDKLCAPPPAMQMGRFCAPPHSLHMDRPTSHSHSIQGDHPRVPQPNLHMNRPCAPPYSQKVDQPIATSYRLLMDRPKPPPQSQDMDRSGIPATSPQPEQALDYSKYRGTSPRQAQDNPEEGRALLTRQSSDGRGHPHHTSAGIYNTDAQTVTGSPAVCSYGSPVPRSNTDFKNLKRHLSDAPLNNQPTPLDDREVAVEICPPKKRVKMEAEESRASSCQLQASFPMPVINNVFSLAPYKAFIEAKQILSSVQSSPKAEEPQHCVVKAEPCDQEDDHHPGEMPVVSSSFAEVKPAVLLDSSKEEPVVKMIELTKIKREPQDYDEISEEVKPEGSLHIPVKNELLEKDSPVSGLMLVIKKCEPDELESKSFKSANDVLSLEKVADPPVEQEKVRPSIHSSPQWTIWPKPATPSQSSDGQSDLQKIPPQSIKLSAYKMILPERLKAAPPTPQAPEKLLPPAQTQVVQGAEDPRPARQHFMELHQALCRLLSKSVTQSPKQELRDWLCKLEHTGPSNPSAKAQNLSGLLGAEARELWLSNVEIRCSLQKILQRLKEYISQHHCPFPHVKRAGAVFIPMLVLKEILFPQVQGVFINQVLQEHKVELRPTTLSEEKTLTQLHKRACSSKLRRLLSLKNLPEIYLDVLNLLYHSCVCKHMESTSLDGVQKTVQRNGSARRGGGGEASEEADISGARSCLQITTSGASSPDAQERREEMKRGLVVEKRNIKSRRLSNSKHSFLKKRRLSRGKVESTKQAANGVIQTTSRKVWDGCPVGSSGDEEREHTEGEENQSFMTLQEEELEDSWKGPSTSDKLFSSPSDETERTSTLIHGNQLSRSDNPQGARKSPSGMILKLRKVLYSKGGLAHYQTVSDPQPHYRPPLPEAREQGGAGDRGPRECDLSWKGSHDPPHRRHQSGRFSLDLGSTCSTSKKARLCRSLMKIKYCPYLSACHSAEHRRRWVLRSAVQRAQRALKKYFPDLVGKRIRHLYEELDKTEVWYRGLVVRVHQAHPNPLKTVFEVQYDSEPEWTYYLELLIDFKKGWLKIED